MHARMIAMRRREISREHFGRRIGPRHRSGVQLRFVNIFGFGIVPRPGIGNREIEALPIPVLQTSRFVHVSD